MKSIMEVEIPTSGTKRRKLIFFFFLLLVVFIVFFRIYLDVFLLEDSLIISIVSAILTSFGITLSIFYVVIICYIVFKISNDIITPNAGFSCRRNERTDVE